MECKNMNKKTLEQLTGQKFVNNLGIAEISHLVTIGEKNALNYLERNSLGEKLNIFEENALFQNLLNLQKYLGLSKIPRKIECYDISHFAGTMVYGSMVVFLDGKTSRKLYRLFKCKEQNNDFENHANVLQRRLEKANLPDWELPDLIIIDGGKGQLSSTFKVLQNYEKEVQKNNCLDIVSLAKKQEEVFTISHLNGTFENQNMEIKIGHQGGIILPFAEQSLFQRIRDEAHRFGITAQRKARLKTATKSKLDDILGIGKITKQKLLKEFGSFEAVVDNYWQNPQKLIEIVGLSIFKKIEEFLKNNI